MTTPVEAGGKERWGIKCGTDSAAATVDITHPTQTTIAQLIALPAPTTPPQNTRLAPVERTAYTVTCTVVRVQQEADGDFHLCLTDAAGNQMIGEIPNPDCVDAASVWHPQIAACRQAFGQIVTLRHEGWTAVHRQMTLVGVGFFDKIHGQSGVAPSGIELHPILSVSPA